MKDMQSLTVKEAEELANENQYLRFEEYKDFTVQLVKKRKNEGHNSYHVEIVTLSKGEKESSCRTMKLEEFCKIYDKILRSI